MCRIKGGYGKCPNYIGDVVDADLKEIVEKGMLSATKDFSFIKDVDFVAICVPTPLDIYQQPGYQLHQLQRSHC